MAVEGQLSLFDLEESLPLIAMYVCELLWFGARLFPSAAHFSRRRSALTHALSITEWMIDIP